jgi:phosphatidylglycerophosphate synthase
MPWHASGGRHAGTDNGPSALFVRYRPRGLLFIHSSLWGVRGMARRVALADIRSHTYKNRDAWWTVALVDPLASRLVRLVSPWRWVTPNRLTVAAFGIGVAAAACFWQRDRPWLVAGALLFHLSFVVDCMDGKIARLNGTGSVFGAWLDYVFDRLRVVACTVGLFGGQYARTGHLAYLWVGGMVVFLDMFRYLNALQMREVKGAMRERLGALAVQETDDEHPVGAPRPQGAVDVYADFRGRFGVLVRLRNVLVRHRIRVHLVSGVEFQMAVFIVAPLSTWIIGVSVGAGALLAAFELFLIYKLWSATQSFQRHVTKVVEQRVGAEPIGVAS